MAFLTTDPIPPVARIHPKTMPVLLDQEDEGRWLFESDDEVCGLAVPFPLRPTTVV